MDNYGLTFKKIRKSKKFTIEYITKEITSPSLLSKFERGETKITINKFFELLKRINVSFEEFMYVHNDFTNSEFKELLKTIKECYYNSNLKLLKKLSATEFEYYKSTGDIYAKLNSIMIKFIISDIENIEIDKNDVQYITNYLWEVDIWGEYELILYGNIIHKIKFENVLLLSNEISKKSGYFIKLLTYRHDMYGIYINTILKCIQENKLSEAKHFFQLVKLSKIPEDFLYEKIIFLFLEGIIDLKSNNIELGKDKSTRALKILEILKCENLHLLYDDYMQTQLNQLLLSVEHSQLKK